MRLFKSPRYLKRNIYILARELTETVANTKKGDRKRIIGSQIGVISQPRVPNNRRNRLTYKNDIGLDSKACIILCEMSKKIKIQKTTKNLNSVPKKERVDRGSLFGEY